MLFRSQCAESGRWAPTGEARCWMCTVPFGIPPYNNGRNPAKCSTFAYNFFQKPCPQCAYFSEDKKSPPCRLTERGAIPYNKSREYTATCGLGSSVYMLQTRNRHLAEWRFHRFRVMRIVTVQPRICNVMVIGIYSPPFRECSPNRPPLMLVYAWSSGL